MAIEKLIEFAKDGQKNTDDLNLTDGFHVSKKPARQWFNWLFNSLTSKVNEIIDADFVPKVDIVDNLTTDNAKRPVSAKQAKNLQDNKLDKTANAASASKLKTPRKINGVNFDGSTDINLPLIGIGQTWHDVSSQRFEGVTYTNPEPRTITVWFGGGRHGGIATDFYVNDEIYASFGGSEPDEVFFSIPIPPAGTYSYKNKPQYFFTFRELK